MRYGKNTFVWTFLAVPLTIYSVFVLLPYASSFLLAFTKWRGVSANITFNGLNNFIKLFNDPGFWNALGNNIKVLVTYPLATLIISLFFAALFNRGIRGATFFRVTFFFPQVLSIAIVAVLWGFIYDPSIGILSSFFRALGINSLTAFAWLSDPKTVLASIIVVAVWQSVGFYMVLLVSGMQSIPGEVFEAAEIDGASEWNLFWRVTLPLLFEPIRTAVIFMVMGAMDMFAYVTILTNPDLPGLNYSGDVLSVYLYRQAFRNQNFGYAIATAVILMLIVLVLAAIGLNIRNRDVVEY